MRAELPDPEKEKEKYWKCPSCGELVEMNLNTCWKCQAPVPETVVHPSTEEMTREIAEEAKFGTREWFVVVLLLLVPAVGFVARELTLRSHPFHDPVSIGLCLAAVFGPLVYFLFMRGNYEKN